MSTGDYETVYLNDDEFRLLLSVSGVKNWYGYALDLKVREVEAEKQLYGILAELYQKGAVDWIGQKASMTGVYKDIFQVLKNSRYCILAVHPDSEDHSEIYYPYKGMAVCIRRSLHDARRLRITCMGADDFIASLEEEGLLPVRIAESAQLPSAVAKYHRFSDEIKAESYFEDDQVCCVFDIHRTHDGRLVERQIVRDAGQFGMVDIQNETGCSCMNIDNKEFLLKWIQAGRQEDGNDNSGCICAIIG